MNINIIILATKVAFTGFLTGIRTGQYDRKQKRFYRISNTKK